MQQNQTFLKDILTNMLENLTPELEKEFADLIESTTTKDKALNLFHSIYEFLEPVADVVGIPDDSYKVRNDEFLDSIKKNPVSVLFHHLALYHDLNNYDQKDQTFDRNLANDDGEGSSLENSNIQIVPRFQEIQTFKIIDDVFVTTYPPEYNGDRRSITIVIDYPYSFCECVDDSDEICPGFFTLSAEVDEINAKPTHLYFTTIKEFWEDEESFNAPIEFTLATNSEKGGK